MLLRFTNLNMEQAATSQHLIILKRNGGLIRSNRAGKFNYYSIAPDALQNIIECIDVFVDFYTLTNLQLIIYNTYRLKSKKSIFRTHLQLNLLFLLFYTLIALSFLNKPL